MIDDVIPERTDYGVVELRREHLGPLPMMVFREWMQAAVKAEVGEANAACLCTVDDEGHPDGRIVLVKGVEDEGLLFYTNYGSRKGRQLAQNPQACLVFWWEPMRRQIRISGRVERCRPEESDAYFTSRPPQSKLGAWASVQSAPIASREALQERFEEVTERFGSEVPRPENWGGYRLVPSRFEFWQGRDSRLHDRFEYTIDGNGEWQLLRLMP